MCAVGGWWEGVKEGGEICSRDNMGRARQSTRRRVRRKRCGAREKSAMRNAVRCGGVPRERESLAREEAAEREREKGVRRAQEVHREVCVCVCVCVYAPRSTAPSSRLQRSSAARAARRRRRPRGPYGVLHKSLAADVREKKMASASEEDSFLLILWVTYPNIR